jgi:D-3-phosphoglycerate dehydrogenase
MAKVLISSRTIGSKVKEPVEFLRQNGHEVIERSDLGVESLGGDLLASVDAILLGAGKVTREMTGVSPSLKVISMIGAGYDTVDIAAATERGIIVTNAPGVNARSVADLTVGLILAAARRIPQADHAVKQGRWERELSDDVYGKALGVIGIGAIGREVIKRVKGFDMEILAYARTPDPELSKALGFTYVTLEDLLTKSDFVSLHLPLTLETKHFLDGPRLNLLRTTSYLINTARAELVDQKVFLEQLRQGRLAGAAVDVFAEEPPDNDPLCALPNVITTPHMGAFTYETMRNAGMHAAKNALDVLSDRRPASIVNPQVYATLSRSPKQ